MSADGAAMTQSLPGRRIMIIRPEGSPPGPARRLEDLGAFVIEEPLTRTAGLAPAEYALLDDALARLSAFTWILFTSAAGVRYFLLRAGEIRGREVDLQAVLPESLRLAAVGSKTAGACRAAGRAADLVPEDFNAEGLVSALAGARGNQPAGVNVLLVRAMEGREILPASLREAGMQVQVAPAYRTAGIPEAAARVARRLERGEIDLVLATSGAALRELASALGCLPGVRRRTAIAALGPVTAEVAKGLGFPVAVVSPKATVESLVDEIEKYFARFGEKPRTGRD